MDLNIQVLRERYNYETIKQRFIDGDISYIEYSSNILYIINRTIEEINKADKNLSEKVSRNSEKTKFKTVLNGSIGDLKKIKSSIEEYINSNNNKLDRLIYEERLNIVKEYQVVYNIYLLAISYKNTIKDMSEIIRD